MNEIDAIIERLHENEKTAKKFQIVETKILSILNFKDLFEVLLTEIMKEFNVPYVWISMIRDSEVQSLIQALGKSELLKEHMNIVGRKSFMELIGDFRSPVLVNTNLKPYFKLLPRNKKFFIKSLAIAPIMLDGQIIGSLNQADSSPYRFKPGIDTSLLEQLALKVSLCLSNVTAHEKLKLFTYHDPLTGLLNRDTMEKILKREFFRSKRYDIPLSLIFLDIDYLKRINDEYGRDCGDDVLIFFSGKLEKFSRQQDISTRFEGDEFVIILPQTQPQEAEALADRIRLHLKTHPCSTREFDIPVHFSYGVASSKDKPIEQWSQLLENAKENLLSNRGGRKPPPKQVGKSRNPNVIKLPGSTGHRDKN